MITYSGVHIQKTGGVAGTPTPVDIAVHAGRICRFGGAVWYPLLPHLVFVGLMAFRRSSGNVADLLWGFLHDAHEAVTSDVPKPFKCDCMREEQKALDVRIRNRFFFRKIGEPNEGLIKRCDTDACDIEAIELGLPNYAEVGAGHKLHRDGAELALFHTILGTPFGQTDTIMGQQSDGVAAFALALQHAENGDYDEFLNEVMSWELL